MRRTDWARNPAWPLARAPSGLGSQCDRLPRQSLPALHRGYQSESEVQDGDDHDERMFAHAGAARKAGESPPENGRKWLKQASPTVDKAHKPASARNPGP